MLIRQPCMEDEPELSLFNHVMYHNCIYITRSCRLTYAVACVRTCRSVFCGNRLTQSLTHYDQLMWVVDGWMELVYDVVGLTCKLW
jgi:hypothetical protein